MKRRKGLFAAIAGIILIATVFAGYNVYRHAEMPRNLPDSSGKDAQAAEPGEETPEEPAGAGSAVPAESGKTLIAYFSWSPSGNTEKMAVYIQEQTNGDLLELEPLNPYPSEYQECTEVALAERDENARPEIANLPDSVEAYDTILIGYPIWRQCCRWS